MSTIAQASQSELDALLGYPPAASALVEDLRQRYLADDIDLDEFEDGVARALAGRPSREQEVREANLIVMAEWEADRRRVMSPWLRQQASKRIDAKITGR